MHSYTGLGRKTAMLLKLCVAVLTILVIAGLYIPAYASNGNIVMLVEGGGAMRYFSRAGETVGQFLERVEKMPRELDTVSVGLDSAMQDGDIIYITRREYVTHTETAAVPYRTVSVHFPEMKAGEERLVQAGANGISERTFKSFVVNGEIVERELLGERVIQAPVDRRIEIGFRSNPVSPYDFGAEFDENHEPAGYTQVLRNQLSTGYWAPQGALTSTGMAPELGVVAVNPRIIPYGSRLFIQSPDGKYIYGYAIAADTGGDLMRGVIDIDCFYPIYADAWNHGVIFVDVFILPNS